MEVETRYQEPLPSGWVLAPIGQLTEPSKERIDPQTIEPTPYVGLEHIEKETGRLIGLGSSDEVRSTKAVFRPGDLLYGKLRPYLNKVCIAGCEGVCSTDILVFPPHKGVSSQYLLYRFLSSDFVRFANLNVSGVQHPRTNFKILSQFDIGLPPLPEQHRIVQAIETQFTRLDAAVAALKRAQARLARYKASVLQAACTGRLVPTEAALARAEGRDYEPADVLLARILQERRARWEAERWEKEVERAKKKAAQAARKAEGLPARIRDLNEEEWVGLEEEAYARYLPKNEKWKAKYQEPAAPDTEGLGELAEGWVWATVEQTAEQRLGKMLDKEKNTGQLRPYLRNLNVRWFVFDLSDIQHLRVEDEELPRVSVREGDLVICEGGEPGRAAVWISSKPFVIQKALHRVRPSDGLSSAYLAYKLAADAANGVLESYFTGSTIRHFTGQSLRSYAFTLPPTCEQSRIVDEVDRRLSVVTALEVALEANLTRAERLRQSILKRAFEGRLVPQDPDDEPASALLARIRAG